eukprot:3350825-Pyramimonas_sp.AAC.1
MCIRDREEEDEEDEEEAGEKVEKGERQEEASGAVLKAILDHLERTWRPVLEASWAGMSRRGGFLGRHGVILEAFGAV